MVKQVLLNARSYFTYDRRNLLWFLWLSLRLWRKFSVFSEFEIVFGSHVIRFSAQSNVRLICYWSDWKGTYLTWPRNCLLWKGKMSTLPSVWKNLYLQTFRTKWFIMRYNCLYSNQLLHWPRYSNSGESLFWPNICNCTLTQISLLPLLTWYVTQIKYTYLLTY